MEIDEFRNERKFVVEDLEHAEILFLIRSSPKIFREIYHERQVNNIYFDSIDLNDFNENVAGNSLRSKIRIRWYGRAFGNVRKSVLEIKIKKGELGKKLSFRLAPFVFEKGFSFSSMQKVFDSSKLPVEIREKLRLCLPSLFNTYIRRYFESMGKKHRITVDREMEFFRLKERKNYFLEKFSSRGVSVFELKYSPKDHLLAGEIMKHFPFRMSAHSKYVRGIDLLNL